MVCGGFFAAVCDNGVVGLANSSERMIRRVSCIAENSCRLYRTVFEEGCCDSCPVNPSFILSIARLLGAYTEGVNTEPDIRAKPGSEYPPGPPFLPRLLTGRLFRGGTINMLRENARRYGDIVHYRAINRKIYQINHPDLIQELLLNDEPRNHRHMVMQRSRFILGNGLLTSEEPLHMRQRRMAAPAFHRHRIAAYGDVIAKYSAEMIEQWQPGALDVYPEMMMLALRIVSKCLFDTDARSEAKKIGDAVDAFMGFLPLAFLPFRDRLRSCPSGQ